LSYEQERWDFDTAQLVVGKDQRLVLRVVFPHQSPPEVPESEVRLFEHVLIDGTGWWISQVVLVKHR
jgi:hypothetical protein